MNNRYDKLLSVLNILIIFSIVAGIIAGLNAIGIFNISDWINGKNINIVLPNDEGQIYKSLSNKKGDDKITVIPDLSEHNVYALLEDVEPADNYYQEVTSTIFAASGAKKVTRASVTKSDGEYDVVLLNHNSQIFKRIRELEDVVSISNFDDEGNETTSLIDKGDFDIQSMSGIVITHESFYETPDNTLAEYNLAHSDLGSILEITFISKLQEYTQVQKYWLSLDFGVVTRAECYEENVLVYLMETSALE